MHTTCTTFGPKRTTPTALQRKLSKNIATRQRTLALSNLGNPKRSTSFTGSTKLKLTAACSPKRRCRT
eukprot:755621-Rhodomonas_salina.1